MHNSSAQMQVEFHNRASQIFFAAFHDFENAAANISRKHDEYKFQELKKLYAITLEKDLQQLARTIIARNNKETGQTDPAFHHLIKEYLHSFIQKIHSF